MNKVSIAVIGILIVGAIGWLAISSRSTPDGSSAQSQSGEAPDFALQDYGGKAVRRADFAGKPLVINSWAAWCPFCREELPAFAAAQKEFGDKVTIIAVDRAESLRVAKGYTDRQGTTGKLIFLLDPSDSFYQSIGGFSMPETIFVDKEGKIVDHKRGPMDLNEIREKIQKILVSAPTSQNETVMEDAVTYGESGFSPDTLRIKVGATVSFKNQRSESMWIASNPHPIHTDYSGFDAKRGYTKGESYSFTFTQSGSWKYHDHLNPGTGGIIIVE